MYTFPTRKTFLQRLLLLALIVAISIGFSPAATSASRVDPVRLLNSLPVSNEVTSGYNRDLFRHWSDLDSDGCDTREEVLIDERTAGSVVGCKVVNLSLIHI